MSGQRNYFNRESIFSVIFLILMVSLLIPINVTGHGDEIHQMAADDHCDNPTEELTISAEKSSHSFDQDKYQVKKNTCYTLSFKNPSDVEHDLQIDPIDDADVNFSLVHLHVANSTAGPNGDGIRSMNILTPDKDMDLEIYCTIEGHENMEATLVVGEGDTSFLPIPFIYSLFGLFSLITISVVRRKH